MKVKQIKPKPDLISDFQIPPAMDQSTYQSDRLKTAPKPAPNIVLPILNRQEQKEFPKEKMKERF